MYRQHATLVFIWRVLSQVEIVIWDAIRTNKLCELLGEPVRRASTAGELIEFESN